MHLEKFLINLYEDVQHLAFFICIKDKSGKNNRHKQSQLKAENHMRKESIHMKKNAITAAALCATLSLSLVLTACAVPGSHTGSSVSATENVQIPTPFIDCGTQEDAETLAGFDIVAPLNIDGYPIRTFQAMTSESGNMIQIFFTNKNAGEILMRKAAGAGDISGGDLHTWGPAGD